MRITDTALKETQVHMRHALLHAPEGQNDPTVGPPTQHTCWRKLETYVPDRMLIDLTYTCHTSERTDINEGVIYSTVFFY